MKRLLAIVLTLMMLFTLAACGSKNSDADTPSADDTLQSPGDDIQTPDEPRQPDTPDTPDAPAEAEPPVTPDTADTSDTSGASDPSEPQQPASNTQQPAAQPEPKPAEDPSTPVQQPAQKPAEDPAGKPEEKPADKPADKPEDNSQPPAQPEEPKEEAPAASGNAFAILDAVWKTYTEKEKFPAGDGPMAMDMSNPDNYTYMLSFPAADTGLIDEAAGLVHMMNLNTFTCGAFHAADSKDLSTLAEDLHTAITGKQWMCGFPDKLVIVTVDQCVLSLYGKEDLVNTFRDKLTAAYPAASVVYDEAISF